MTLCSIFDTLYIIFSFASIEFIYSNVDLLCLSNALNMEHVSTKYAVQRTHNSHNVSLCLCAVCVCPNSQIENWCAFYHLRITNGTSAWFTKCKYCRILFSLCHFPRLLQREATVEHLELCTTQ